MRIDHDLSLAASYTSHSGERIAGFTILGVGIAAGVGMTLGSLFTDILDFHGRGWPASETSLAVFVSGAVILVASLVVGLVLGLRRDEVSLREIIF